MFEFSCIFVGVVLPALLRLLRLATCRCGLSWIARCGVDQTPNLVVVTLRLFDEEVAPVNRNKPPNKVDGGQKLDETDSQLGLVDVRIAKASANHRADAW